MYRLLFLSFFLASYALSAQALFTDISQAAGIVDAGNQNHGIAIADYDNDGDEDIYAFTRQNENKLFENQGDGTFKNVAPNMGIHYSNSTRAAVWGDLNNDGWLDLYITDLDENFLFLNQAGTHFVNIAQEAGVDDTGMGWSCVFADVDNDGWEDLYVINDSYFSPEANILYRNLGNGQFEQIEKEGAISSKKGGIGGARADVNQDGYPELIISNHLQGEGNQLFLNQGRENNWLQIQLQGRESNHSAIGAMVQIRDNIGHSQIRQVMAGTGYASQSSMILSFGLEKATLVEQVKIFWPSGQVDVHEDLPINQQHLFTESSLPKAVDSLFSFLTIQPNPIEQYGQLLLQIPSEGELQITVLNQLGQPIQEVCRQFVQAGRFSYHWEEIPLAAGLYFLQAKLDNQMNCYQSFVKR